MLDCQIDLDVPTGLPVTEQKQPKTSSDLAADEVGDLTPPTHPLALQLS
jgi:hypothetical protein